MGCWCGYLSEARCRLFTYGPADATESPERHHLLPNLHRDFLVPAYTQVVLGKKAVKRVW